MAVFQEEIKRRMREAVGAKNDRALSEAIGRSTGSVAEWRSRGRIPRHAIEAAALVGGVSAEWIETGREEPRVGRVREALPYIYKDPATAELVDRLARDPEAGRWCMMLLLVLDGAEPEMAEWLKGNILTFAQALGIDTSLCRHSLRKKKQRRKATPGGTP